VHKQPVFPEKDSAYNRDTQARAYVVQMLTTIITEPSQLDPLAARSQNEAANSR
jgi:hypothetical protein